MTTICGIWHFDGRPNAGMRLQRMQGALTMYGRNRQNRWEGGDIAIASGLTNTVPEDRFDRQPLNGGAGRFTLVADLRLDNREELAAKLEIRGERLAEMADSTLLLAGWERWQTGVMDHLVGPFCFAVWDRTERTLTLVRDHLGMRPLYFHVADGWFAFATMPKGLLALPEIPSRLNERRLMDYAMMQSLGSDSYYAGIDGLAVGHVMVVKSDGRRTSRAYWDPLAVPSLEFRRREEYGEGLRDVLTTAVRAAVRTTTAIGSQLSAGYDSTAVTAMAARLLAERGQALTAFTAIPRPGYTSPAGTTGLADEGPVAALVAARYPNIRHRLIQAPPGGLLEVLDRYAFHHDQPLLNPVNGLWLDELHRAARDGNIGVMLTGGGGNFTLSFRGDGYFRELYEAGRWRELAGALLTYRGEYFLGRAHALRQVGRWVVGETAWAFLRRTLRGTGQLRMGALSSHSPLHPSYFATGAERTRLRERGYLLAWPAQPATKRLQAECLVSPGFRSTAKGVLAAFGIDCRAPARDLRVARFCLGIPLGANYRNGRFRGAYRDAFAGWVPREVMELNRFGAQGADWHLLLRSELPAFDRELARFSALGDTRPLLDVTGLRELVATYPESDDGTPETAMRFHHKLIRGIAAARFMRRALGWD